MTTDIFYAIMLIVTGLGGLISLPFFIEFCLRKKKVKKMKEIKTWIRWGALVLIILIGGITLKSTFSDRYTVRIEASPEVRDIALKYADVQVDLYEIKYNCSEYVEMEQSKAKSMELVYACKFGCQTSFDGVDDGHGAVGIGGFMRHSCIDICLDKFVMGD